MRDLTNALLAAAGLAVRAERKALLQPRGEEAPSQIALYILLAGLSRGEALKTSDIFNMIVAGSCADQTLHFATVHKAVNRLVELRMMEGVEAKDELGRDRNYFFVTAKGKAAAARSMATVLNIAGSDLIEEWRIEWTKTSGVGVSAISGLPMEQKEETDK